MSEDEYENYEHEQEESEIEKNHDDKEKEEEEEDNEEEEIENYEKYSRKKELIDSIYERFMIPYEFMKQSPYILYNRLKKLFISYQTLCYIAYQQLKTFLFYYNVHNNETLFLYASLDIVKKYLLLQFQTK